MQLTQHAGIIFCWCQQEKCDHVFHTYFLRKHNNLRHAPGNAELYQELKEFSPWPLFFTPHNCINIYCTTLLKHGT